MDVASFLDTFMRGWATGERTSVAAATPGARRMAIPTGSSMPIVLGTRSRKIIIMIEPKMMLTSHPYAPKASENRIAAVVARATLAKVPISVVTLTSLVFSFVILSAVLALLDPSFCMEKRETCLTERYVASTM